MTAKISSLPGQTQATIPQRKAVPATPFREELEFIPLECLVEEELSLPRAFGRYVLEKQIGQGGMGIVYLAHDTSLDRKVALKVPRFSVGDTPEKRERFLREARFAATLDHPNICPLYDVGEIDSMHYLTMAFIEGESLFQYIAKSGRSPSTRKIAVLIRKIALALAEAHRRGIVHRDLKPSNILINHRGEPIVMDFGIARHISSEECSERMIIGTPGYMAPEQARGNQQEVGPQADVYSLGVILYELLTGELPHKGTSHDILNQLIQGVPPPLPSTIRSEVDRDLESICMRATAVNPETRYPSMTAFADALYTYLRINPTTKKTKTAESPVSKRRRINYGRILLGLVFFGAFLAWEFGLFHPMPPATLPLKYEGPMAKTNVFVIGKRALPGTRRDQIVVDPGDTEFEVRGPRIEPVRIKTTLKPGLNPEVTIPIKFRE